MNGTTIIDAVLNQLKEDIPEVKHRYLERQKQNVKRPCFIVKQVLSQNERRLQAQNQFIGDKYKRTYRMRIIYVPSLDAQRPIRECENIGERLFLSFRKLNLDNTPLWCRNCECEIINGELHFSFDLTVYAVWSEEKGPAMKTMGLDETLTIKEE